MKPSDEHADSVFYGIAAKEMQAGNVDVGLMAKAVHQAKGNKQDAEILYLGWRVELLKEEAVDEFNRKKEEAALKEMQLNAERERKAEAEREKWKKEAGSYDPTGFHDKDTLKIGLIIIGVIVVTVILLSFG
jgi:hypothetical protein